MKFVTNTSNNRFLLIACCSPTIQLYKFRLLCVLGSQDTAGQERFHALGPIYYRDSNGAVLVYDITDEDSFLKVLVPPSHTCVLVPPSPTHVLALPLVCFQVKNWVKELRKMLGNDICLCIVGKL